MVYEMNCDMILCESDENKIRKLLMYRKVVKVDNSTNTLTLDNGTELNECDNAITNVEFVCDGDTKDSYDETSYKILFMQKIGTSNLLRLMEMTEAGIMEQAIPFMSSLKEIQND